MTYCVQGINVARFLQERGNSTPNPICCGDSGGRAGFLTKPYKCEKVQILESELVLTHFCKAASQ